MTTNLLQESDLKFSIIQTYKIFILRKEVTMENLQLAKIANEVRKNVVTALHSAKSGHPGGSLSAADMLTFLYFERNEWS